VEAKTYESELSNWPALLVDRRREGKSLSLEEERDLKGLVTSGKEQLRPIIEKR
jgi:hypothetical protein